ncbi:MAG: 4-(cytidine 5'-diphospho)-2-C-methyl-D-erythritol kinase [Aquificaceae bacterium]|nr:4-(cytidine 5'-diphospho)-2-C-methyl-D-erythritol kinase [Aquificaceae bacterium]MDW8066306.1 4-(cytidine 5'-diphospho)-2-C-methyl-D-erythritol kinase [Aquificaceae bacterium]MDW8422744.1 4-(cytidine 5'-diphospho)-2-C-methyl-D-erythritol kinase [Aquificaceae bacterium]
MERILSPAKLNLGLWLLGKRSDGYHEIFTIYHTVSVFDEIFIKEGPLKVETSTGIPMEKNLVYKGIRIMEKRLGKELNFQVYIKKNIPEGAGLGGGSSNLATVMKGINELLGEPFTLEELISMAADISSDAPFFLVGGSAVGRGRGEILQKINLPPMTFTIVHPRVSCSTSYVYSRVSEKMLTRNLKGDKIVDYLRAGNFSLLENKLGELAAELYPEVGEALRFLRSLGLQALVSGSGSSVYYIGEPQPEVRTACQLRGWKLYRAESYGV